MSTKPVLQRPRIVLGGAGLILALVFVGWLASHRRGDTHVDRSPPVIVPEPTDVAAKPSPPQGRKSAEEGGPPRDTPQRDDPLSTLFGAALRVADKAGQVAIGNADDASVMELIEATADGMREGLNAADDLLPRLDPDVAKEFGNAFRSSVLSDHTRIVDRRLIGLVMPVWDEVVLASRERPGSLTITLVDNPDVNAFAFVGRNVVVNRGFIDFAVECSRTKDVIRFVLAHELGHIICGHTDRLFRRMVAADQIVPGAGVAPAIIESIVKQTPISQAAEREADCFARRMHVDNGWTLDGGREFFTRVQRMKGRPSSSSAIESLLGSHPDESRRLQLLETGSGCGE